MTFKEIQDLLRYINKSNLTEFKMKQGDFELSVRTKKFRKSSERASVVHVPAQPSIIAAPAPVTQPAAVQSDGDVASSKENPDASGNPPLSDSIVEIKSPIVGTFYRSPSPDKPAYLKVGDRVEVGSVVCIVEAMKLFNEIESELNGKIIKVLVDDASPVEFDQPLFLLDPS